MIERTEYLLQSVLGNTPPKDPLDPDQRLRALLLMVHAELLAKFSADEAVARFGVYLYLVLLARYPRVSELGHTRFLTIQYGPQKTIDDLLDSSNFQNFISVSHLYVLSTVDPSLLHVDISHTLTYALNSGIQRVVRCFLPPLLDQKKPICLFYMSDKEPRPVRVPPAELDRLVNWEKYSHSTIVLGSAKTKGSFPRRLLSALVRQAIKFPVVGGVKALEWSIDYLFGFTNYGRRLAVRLGKKLKPYARAWALKVDVRHIHVLPGSKAYRKEVLILDEPLRFLIPELPLESYVDFYINAKKHFGVTSTAVVYDLIPLMNPEFCAPSLKAAFADYLRLFRAVDRFSCISKDVADKTRHFISVIDADAKRRVEVHYLGANSLRPANENPPIEEDLPMVLCVGTFEPRKNGITLLRAAAAAQSRGVKFKLVFAGNLGWMVREFIAQFEEMSNQGYKIQCLEHVSEDKLHELYRTCRFTVFCSLQEGFGLPIVESLHFGKPCIVSNLGSMKEIAAGGGCVPLADPLSFEAVANEIESLLTDRARYERLQAEARAFKWPNWTDYGSELFDFAVKN